MFLGYFLNNSRLCCYGQQEQEQLGGWAGSQQRDCWAKARAGKNWANPRARVGRAAATAAAATQLCA